MLGGGYGDRKPIFSMLGLTQGARSTNMYGETEIKFIS